MRKIEKIGKREALKRLKTKGASHMPLPLPRFASRVKKQRKSRGRKKQATFLITSEKNQNFKILKDLSALKTFQGLYGNNGKVSHGLLHLNLRVIEQRKYR